MAISYTHGSKQQLNGYKAMDRTNEQALITKTKTITPAQAYLISLGAETSRTTVKAHLTQLARLLEAGHYNHIPWQQFTRQHLLAVVQSLKNQSKAPTTIKSYLATIKGVCREAWAAGIMSTDTFTHIKEVRAPRGNWMPKGRSLSVIEVQQLLSICAGDKSCRGIRDAAIIAIMVGCGLRRAEVVGLQYDNLIHRDQAMRIMGKGNRERINYLPAFAWQHLDRWIEAVRGDIPGPLFTRIRAGDDVTTNALTVNGLAKVLEYRRIESLWIEAFSPHDLRRTYASRLLEMNTDLNTVKDLMGHASITTTQKYDHRDKKRLEQAGRKLSY